MPELVHQVNVRRAVRRLGPSATLDDLDDAWLGMLAGRGVDWVYLLGLWPTGRASRDVALADAALMARARELLPDLAPDDVSGSPFATTGYSAMPALGGDAALRRLRERMHRHGLRLMGDFVPNHSALDHPWVRERPEVYVQGTPADLERDPGAWIRVGGRVLAHGRDPNLPPWTDTLQFDHTRPGTARALTGALLEAAERVDGLRVDMAMLLLPEVVARTWGRPGLTFWPDAIGEVRRRHPGILLVAEVYWGLGPALRSQGFDRTYDKDWYDALRDRDLTALGRWSRGAGQRGEVRFLENHDEARAVAVFGAARLPSAATATFLSPAVGFVQDGQVEGRAIHTPVQLDREPAEPDRPAIHRSYEQILALRGEAVPGTWTPIEVDDPGVIGHVWSRRRGGVLLALANLGSGAVDLAAPGAARPAWAHRADVDGRDLHLEADGALVVRTDGWPRGYRLPA